MLNIDKFASLTSFFFWSEINRVFLGPTVFFLAYPIKMLDQDFDRIFCSVMEIWIKSKKKVIYCNLHQCNLGFSSTREISDQKKKNMFAQCTFLPFFLNLTKLAMFDFSSIKTLVAVVTFLCFLIEKLIDGIKEGNSKKKVT